MKHAKKLFSLALALIMALALAVPAMAATIKVDNAVDGQTYSAYKIFDVTKSTDGKNYNYYIDSGSKWFTTVQTFATEENGLTLEQVGSTTRYNVVVGAAFDTDKAAELAIALNKAFKEMESKPTPDGTATGVSGKAEITVADAGYYFVDSSLGALCALLDTDDSTILVEKNDKPEIDKTVADGDEDGHGKDVSIGDVVNFTITVTAGGAADTSYIVHDSMTDGLTFNNDVVVKVGETTLTNGDQYILTAPATHESYGGQENVTHTFDIEFPLSYTSTLAQDTEIVITYSATVNKNANTGDVDPETNKAILDYGDSSDTTEEPTEIRTYEFDVVKTDDKNAVISTGAEFKLYDALTGGNEIELIWDAELNAYRPVMDEETAADSLTLTNGTFKVVGLADGKYYLEETVAPDGYNLLTARQEVDLTKGNVVLAENALADNTWNEGDGGIQVVNKSGAQLPGTGGMGTTIFYVVGGVLMAGAAVLLVTKKKMSR